ncbi:MAG: MerR family transcriptional regulator [Chitinophagaceae bacterium]
MNLFSIGDIENLTQIKAHTLRIWEQRHGLCIGKRRESRHRFYDGDDLKQILHIALLYKKGKKISHISKLSKEEIRLSALSLSDNSDKFEVYITRLIETSIDMDPIGFVTVVNDAITHTGMETAVLEIIFPFFKKIGMLWLTGHAMPAQEHFASSIITQKIISETDKLPFNPHPQTTRRVLLFTPVGEYHEMPLLFMKFLLKKNGIPHTYMGKSIEFNTLLEYSSKQEVTELFFVLITNLTHTSLDNYLKQLSNYFPNKKISCTGYSCSSNTGIQPGINVIKNTDEVLAFASIRY